MMLIFELSPIASSLLKTIQEVDIRTSESTDRSERDLILQALVQSEGYY
jgi:hypothetical protein